MSAFINGTINAVLLRYPTQSAMEAVLRQVETRLSTWAWSTWTFRPWETAIGRTIKLKNQCKSLGGLDPASALHWTDFSFL